MIRHIPKTVGWSQRPFPSIFRWANRVRSSQSSTFSLFETHQRRQLSTVVSTSATQRADAEKLSKQQHTSDAKSDWYYVAWGSAALLLLGGPAYFLFLLRYDAETREWSEQNAPSVVEFVKQYIDIYADAFDPDYRNVERNLGEEHIKLVSASGQVHELCTASNTLVKDLEKEWNTKHPTDPIVDIRFVDEPNTNIRPISALAIHRVEQWQIDVTNEALDIVDREEQALISKVDTGNCSTIEREMSSDMLKYYEEQKQLLRQQLNHMHKQFADQAKASQRKPWYKFW